MYAIDPTCNCSISTMEMIVINEIIYTRSREKIYIKGKFLEQHLEEWKPIDDCVRSIEDSYLVLESGVVEKHWINHVRTQKLKRILK